jgi:pyruvate/2-oxoglutarate dehydrogenase complex dihydrolipoamide acyltransferase (E2) component
VNVEEGLIVPVIKNADKKSIAEISKELRVLVEKARTGKLLLDDMSDGTFTISNIGVFGSHWQVNTPIINQPQSAILGTGAIIERPVVRNGQIVIGQIMTASLTFDHRVIDGAPAAKFIDDFSQLLECPSRLLL